VHREVLVLEGRESARVGLPDGVQRDVDGDLLALADDHEVEVLEHTQHGVDLHVLDERELVASLDVEGDDLVGRAADDEEGLVVGQVQVHRVSAVTVEDGGDLAGAAGPAGGALAELGADGGGELVVSHGYLRSVVGSGPQRGTSHGRT